MRRCFVLVLMLCACGDVGLGVPGTGPPLPDGGLPASQTLEGGAQLEVSASGLEKILARADQTITGQIDQGFCVGQQSILGANVCYENQGACTPGCAFHVAVSDVAVSVTSDSTLDLEIDADGDAAVRIDPPIFSACTLNVTIDSLKADVDVGLGIDPTTGALTAGLRQINDSELSGVNFSGCSVISFLASLVTDLLDSATGTWIADSVTPAIQNAIVQVLPPPQEVAAMVDLPGLTFVGPGASNGSAVETRIGPGGYATFQNGGVSLGVLTGFNSDADPETRSPSRVSEPAACVAGLSAPDLAAPPFSLAATPRGSFAVAPEGPFVGSPPPPTGDFLLGISRTTLDLAGHHLVASGGLCLTIDTDRVAYLRRDVLDDLLGLPLGASDSALRAVVRPQSALRFTVGDGTTAPHLTAAFDVAIDIDSVSAGGGTFPVLTLTAELDTGLRLDVRHAGGQPLLETTRASFAVVHPAVEVFDARYAGIAAADLDALAGTLADVVSSVLGADAGVYPLPTLAGMDAEVLDVEPVVTASDEFLAIRGSLPIPPSGSPAAPTPQPLATTVVEPTPDALRAALRTGSDAGLPAVHVELPTTDGLRPLEHAWRTQGGAWHAYTATGDLVVRDRSFAWQGERTIELRSRVVGNDATTSPIGSTSVAIDYAPPAIFPDQATLGTYLVVPARDASSAVEWAMGRVGEDAPVTDWTSDPKLDPDLARGLGADVVVYVRDAAGNVAHATVHVPEPDAAATAGIAVAMLASLRSRRRSG